jgi:hypothetical protein
LRDFSIAESEPSIPTNGDNECGRLNSGKDNSAIGILLQKRDYDRRYRIENKDKIRKSRREYYFRNKDLKLEYDLDYRARNKDNRRDYSRDYLLRKSDDLKEKNHQFYIRNKDNIKEKSRNYYVGNKVDRKDYDHKYYVRNRDNWREWNRKYYFQSIEFPETYVSRDAANKSWKSPELVREYFESIGKKLGISIHADWYLISRFQLVNLGGV